ncbi:VOC family protein [Streptomyces sp. NPDC058280]|uniref:VOC family protein n=1 Tax=Streptomyces sp. NPDC058280 TaxID=3346419 RepID=UPI0036E36445
MNDLQKGPSMQLSRVIVSLPVADRRASFAFYRDGLGLDAIGEAAQDGVPEPLQFALNDGLRLMLVPSGGFGWVIGGREVAGRDQSECVFSLHADDEAAVAELIERAHRAGGSVVTPPGPQPWGYAGAFCDPDGHVWMVTSQTLPA